MTPPAVPGLDVPGLALADPAGRPVRSGGLSATEHRATLLATGAPVRLLVLDATVDGRRGGAQLAREAAALTALRPHPSLVLLLAAGVLPDGRAWRAEAQTPPLELVRPVDPAPALRVLEALADGVAALHAAGHVHGPLDDADLRGSAAAPALSGALLPALTGAGDPPPALLPPEVLAGRPWTPAADVWALAALLWRLLHGRPHAADELAAVQGTVPEPRADLPGPLRVGLVAGLAPDPAARPAGPAALLSLLSAGDSRETLPPTSGLLAAPEVERGRPLGSGYLLLTRIGRGATGQVWQGVRRRDGRDVAVKLLRPELSEDTETVVRFLRERSVLVGLDHPGLVHVHDLVAEDGVLAVVMDLVPGTDLRRVLAERPPAPAAALELVAQVAAALATVHDAGIVHRDLKPENVLVEPGGAARLTDFGIARAVGAPALTRLSAIVGTPEYLAPEIASGREASAASDVYALGIVLYELLTGRRPFDAPHPAAVLRAHLQDAPARPDDLPEPVWDLLASCLAKEPATRPAAADLPATLRRLVTAVGGRAQPYPAAPATPSTAAPATGLGDSVTAPPALDPLPATAALPTTGATVLAPEPPPAPSPPLAPWFRRRALLLACVLAVAVAGVGGWVVAAPDGPPPAPPGPAFRQDLVPVAVFADPGPEGTVRLRFDGSRLGELQGFVVLADGQPVDDGLPANATDYLATPSGPGQHCYTVLAVVQVAASAPAVPAAEPPPAACLDTGA